MHYYTEFTLPPLLSGPDALNFFLAEKDAGVKTFSNRKYNYVTTEFHDKLNPEIVKIFNDRGIMPEVLEILGHVPTTQDFPCDRHLVHVDLTYSKSKGFVTLPMALTWELTDTKTTLYWWDPKHNPVIEKPVNPALLQHDWYRFGRARVFSDSDQRSALTPDQVGFELLQTYKPSKGRAFILNTAIPHSATYEPGHERRVYFSLRFPVQQIASYEAALELFKEFVV